MHLKLKHSLLIVLSTILFAMTNTQEVNACSGGQPLTVAGLINNSDYVVKAQITDVDDLGQNVILHIESYLAGGSGPE
jgi:hypothetical protein